MLGKVHDGKLKEENWWTRLIGIPKEKLTAGVFLIADLLFLIAFYSNSDFTV